LGGAFAEKDRLPPVRVAGLFIEHQYSQKVCEIRQTPQLLVGKEVVRRGFRGLAGITRAKLLTSFAGRAPAPQLHHHVVCVRDEIFANVHNVCSGTRNPNRAANLVLSNSFASIRNPCGLFWNFTP
jgi:hypothetical protein